MNSVRSYPKRRLRLALDKDLVGVLEWLDRCEGPQTLEGRCEW